MTIVHEGTMTVDRLYDPYPRLTLAPASVARLQLADEYRRKRDLMLRRAQLDEDEMRSVADPHSGEPLIVAARSICAHGIALWAQHNRGSVDWSLIADSCGFLTAKHARAAAEAVTHLRIDGDHRLRYEVNMWVRELLRRILRKETP